MDASLSLIKECSAFAFILAALVRDTAIVLLGATWFCETVVLQQYVGFAVCMSGVFFWSCSKIDPESPAVQLFHRATCSEVAKPDGKWRMKTRRPPCMTKDMLLSGGLAMMTI